MEWSPAPSSWDPTQLPGLTSTVVHADSALEPSSKPGAMIVNAQQIIADLIRFTSNGNAAIAESLSQAHRCLSWDAVVAGLNVRFDISALRPIILICMESLARFILQLNTNDLDTVIEAILSSPDAPAAQWLRLLVALFSTAAVSPLASGLASHASNLIQNWLTASPHSLAPITIIVLHLHRQLIPAVLLVLERDLAAHNPANIVRLDTPVGAAAVRILDYASTVRPEDIVKQAEALCQRIEALLEENGSANALWEIIRLIVPLLAQNRLAECLLPQLLEFVSSKSHLEQNLYRLLEADLAVSKQNNSLEYKGLVVSQLRNVILERITLLGSTSLAQVLLLAQRMQSWQFTAEFSPKSAESMDSMFESIVSKLYDQLMDALNEAAPVSEAAAPVKAAASAAASHSKVSQSLKELLENTKIEQELNPDVYNMLFRWLSFATAAAESAQASSPFAPAAAAGAAARGPTGANSDKFKSMMVRIFKTAVPAYYVDRVVLDELDKTRQQLSATEISTILQNIKLHLEGEPAANSFNMEEINRHVPFRLLLKALDFDESAFSKPRDLKWALEVCTWVLKQCCEHVTPMNLYLFVHSGLEMLLELLCSHQAALSLNSDSQLHKGPTTHRPMESQLVLKIEWLRKSISFLATRNLHLHNVVVAFVVKHLTVPDAIGATLTRRLNRKSTGGHDALFTCTAAVQQPEHDDADRASKRVATEAPIESGRLRLTTSQLCESAQFSLLNLIVTSLRNGKEKSEKISVISDQLLLRVMPPVPAPTNEQYADILPRKPIFDRDVAIEHQLSKCPAIMSVLEVIALSPVEVARCSEFVRSCLAIVIGRWNLLASSQAQLTTSQFASPPLIALTQQLWRIISGALWLPALLANCEEIFSVCTPQESVQILMAVWIFIKENPPIPGLFFQTAAPSERHPLGLYDRTFKTDVNVKTASYVNILMLILRKNVHRLPGLLLSKLRELHVFQLQMSCK